MKYENGEKTNFHHNEFVKNGNKTDVNFRLIYDTRRRIHHALRNVTKSSSIVFFDIDSFRKRVENQMKSEMNWLNTEIDHVKPIPSVDVSKDEQLREAINWTNRQPQMKKNYQHEGAKIDFLEYRLQLMKAYQFIKLNKEGLIKDFHR